MDDDKQVKISLSAGVLHILTDRGLTCLARRDRAAVGLTLDR